MTTSTNKVFNFREDLARGDVGEQQFLRTFPTYVKANPEDMYECDFVCTVTGNTVELKTDYYDLNTTPNLIVEKVSNDKKGTPGGPYRHSKELGSWVYYYIKNGTFYWYQPGALIECIEELPTFSPIRKEVIIPNRGYNTIVLRVPRTLAEQALMQIVQIDVK